LFRGGSGAKMVRIPSRRYGRDGMRHEGGKRVMVAPQAADAARRRYASGRRPDVHERTQPDSAEAIDRARADADEH